MHDPHLKETHHLLHGLDWKCIVHLSICTFSLKHALPNHKYFMGLTDWLTFVHHTEGKNSLRRRKTYCQHFQLVQLSDEASVSWRPSASLLFFVVKLFLKPLLFLLWIGLGDLKHILKMYPMQCLWKRETSVKSFSSFRSNVLLITKFHGIDRLVHI